MAAIFYLHPDLARRLSLSYPSEIGSTVSTYAKDGVTTLAALALEDRRATLPRIFAHRMCGIGFDADESNQGEKDSACAGCASG